MPLPKKWQGFFVGRKVTHPDTTGLQGVVKYATSTRMGKLASEGTGTPVISSQFYVEWDNGEAEVIEDTDVAKIATDEFIKEDWVHERILKLQECGWDEAKANAMKSKPASKPRTTAVTSSPPKAPRGAPPTRAPAPAAAEPKKRKASAAPASQAAGGSERPAKKAAAQAPLAANGPAAAAPAPEKPKASKKKASTKAEPSGSAIIGSPPRAPAAPAPSPRQVAFPGASSRAAPRPKPLSSPFLHVEDLTHALVRGKHVFQYDFLTVGDTQFRVYCRDVIAADALCFRPRRDDGKPPDMSVATWKIRGDYNEAEEEYEVDCIVAERRARNASGCSVHSGSSNATQYLIKFTRFELDPGPESWLPLAEVEEMAAYEAWLKGGREAWRTGVRAVHAAAGLEG